MRQAEKLRYGLPVLIFIFLCAQSYYIVGKANFWKSVSEQTRKSYLSAGNDNLLPLAECFSDAHSGFSDDTSSTLFFSASAVLILLKTPEIYERSLFFTSQSLASITKYHRSVIAIQTVK
ncbi:MAG: hypothetical protein WCR31_02400 [Treponema sp.]